MRQILDKINPILLDFSHDEGESDLQEIAMFRSLKICVMLLSASLATPLLWAKPQCVPLKVVGSGLYAVNKSISVPATGIVGNNWNTDFAVPSRNNFRSYVARVQTPRNGQYDLKLVLKYPDGSSRVAYEQAARAMGVNDSFRMTARPRSMRKEPYQVNLLVGGTTVVGNTITATVSGCS